MFLILFMVLSL